MPKSPEVKELERLREKEDEGETPTEADIARYRELAPKLRRERFDAIPKLDCCDDVRRYHVIRFVVDIYDEDDPAKQRAYWYVPACESLKDYQREHDPDWLKVKSPEPKFCPFCATPVPKMRLKAEPPKYMLVCTDGGYYCDTCGERLMSCQCLPPEAAYERVP